MVKAYVGVSGGVDSAVSAALLKQKGYDVTAVFIKIWSPEFVECTWREDRLDALRVAAALEIPFVEIDLSKQYKESVLREMLAAYERGVTPNPDVVCNTAIKFGAFYSWAREQGADVVATGHYANVSTQEGRPVLKRARDAAKDQSYFLYTLTQDKLAHIEFPVGNLFKKEVRNLAVTFGLPVASKRDSQGLCFVGDITMSDFLSRYITLKKGPVLNRRGEIIGEHEGSALYTLGQRHGFKIHESPNAAPQYVTGIDSAHNTMTVSSNSEDALSSKAHIEEPHWIGLINPSNTALFAVTRYHGTEHAVHLEKPETQWIASFTEPQLLTSGQSMVFYTGDTCRGGAIILDGYQQ